MKISPRHCAAYASGWRGFSLPETVIAIGIVATALLPLIALLGTTTRSQVTSTDRMAAAFIADAVFAELAASAPQSTLFVGAMEQGEGMHQVAIFAAESKSRAAVVYFVGGVDGGLIGEISEAIYESGYQTNAAAGGEMVATILRLQFTAEAGGEPSTADAGGLFRLRLSAEHPADAGRLSRHREVFETFLNLSER